MALIFSLSVQCSSRGDADALARHFDGLRWPLASGGETTLSAGPYVVPYPVPPTQTAIWVTPSNITTSGIRDDRDAATLTELGDRLYARLRDAPPFEFALVGVEVDHYREELDIIDLIRSYWTGIVVTDAIWRKAGAPIAYEPFRDGMRWRPYTGEWSLPYGRPHVPDVAVVTCLGCDEPIRDHELVRHEDHGEQTCCAWHPYHAWCFREAPPAAGELGTCAECGGVLDLAHLRAATGWAAASIHHLHLRTVDVGPPYGITERPDKYAGRLRGVRQIAVATPAIPRDERTPYDRHELVHEDCPLDDSPASAWRARLRASPDDDELRSVYADWLEQAADARADLVRLAIAARRSTGEQARAYAERLRRLPVPRGWLRDVCRGS